MVRVPRSSVSQSLKTSRTIIVFAPGSATYVNSKLPSASFSSSRSSKAISEVAAESAV